MEATSMAAILSSVGEVFTQGITWIGDVLGTIASEPVALLLVIGLPVTGFAFGLARRIIRL